MTQKDVVRVSYGVLDPLVVFVMTIVVPSCIFQAYDIRGVVAETLTVELAYLLGRAVATALRELKEQSLIIGRDARPSSNDLFTSFSQGVLEGGIDVIDVGCCPTPVVYYAMYALSCYNSVVITGSHNPIGYNGFKLVLANETLYGERIWALYTSIQQRCFSSGCGRYIVVHTMRARYFAAVFECTTVHKRVLTVVVDCGNGVVGDWAPALLTQLHHKVIPLYCEVLPSFPHHHPDPSRPENLQDLRKCVLEHHADIGLAFDGDGDRLGVVTAQGEIVAPDRQLMIFSADILSRYPGTAIVYDVKCSNHLTTWIQCHGGRPVMSRTGHSYLKKRLREEQALLGGEMSGHLFFKERWWGFDDGLYAAVRLLELLSLSQDGVALFEHLPCAAFSTLELQMPVPENQRYTFIERITEFPFFRSSQNCIDIDGLRIEYADGWGLMRPSNTMPLITFRFEADTKSALCRIQNEFRVAIQTVAKGLTVPF